MLDKFEFDDMPLSIDDTVLCSVRMFVDLGLVNEFHIDMKVQREMLIHCPSNNMPIISPY